MKDIDKLRIEYKKEGYALIRYDDGPVHSYPYNSPWLVDPDFNKLYEKMRHNTLVDRPRCYALYLLMDQIKDLPGDVFELGTWRGGTAAIFASCLPSKTIYLADTFEGVVKSSEWEHYVDKVHADTSQELVEDFLRSKVGVSNYKILKGIFPEDTGGQVKTKKFAFAYLDADVYRSTKEAFDYIWSNICVNGIVAFDDYGMTSACPGISKFINAIKGDTDKIFASNMNGQAYVIKK